MLPLSYEIYLLEIYFYEQRARETSKCHLNFFTLSTTHFADYFSSSLGATHLIYYSIKAAKSKL